MAKSKQYRTALILGAIYGALLVIYLMISSEIEIKFEKAHWIILGSIVGVLFALLIQAMTQLLNRLIPWQSFFGIRLIVGILSTFAILHLPVVLGLYFGNSYFENAPFSEFLKSGIQIKSAVLLFVLSSFGNMIYLAFYSFTKYSLDTISVIKSEREQIDLQINALKSQLSPHFLFNNLNTISSLIHKDQIKAESFIRKMASCYQYILNSYNTSLVSLDQELEFVKSSMHLLKTRFRNTGELKIEVDKKTLATKIPTLTIQMLVENAMKHNISTVDNPVNIRIHSDGRNVYVSNNKTTKPQNVESTKVGLENIIHRYKLLGKEDVSVEDNSIFSVKLPFIK